MNKRVARLRLPVLVLIIGTTVLALGAAVKLETRTDPRTMLPDGAAEFAEYEAFAETFGSDRVMAMVLVRPGGFFEPERLEELSGLCDEIEAIPWVRSVESITHTTSVASRGGVIEARALFTDPPFTGEEVALGREEVLSNPVFLRHLVSPSGGAVAVMAFLEERTVAREVVRRLPEEVAADPVAFGEAGEALQGTFNDVGMALALGELEGDADEAKVDAVVALGESGIDGGAPLVSLVRRLEEQASVDIGRYDREVVETFRELADGRAAAIAPTVAILGAPALRLGVADRMALDVQQALLGSVVLVFLLCWVALRDPLRVPLPVGATMVGVLWTLGFCSLLGMEVDQVFVASVFPTAALALTCSVVLCSQDPIPRSALVGVLGSGAFLSAASCLLWLSDVQAVRDFGTVQAIGSLTAAFAATVTVQLTVSLSPNRLPTAPLRPQRRVAGIIAVSIGLTSGFGLNRMAIGTDISGSLMDRDPLAQAYQLVEQQLSGMDAFRLHLEVDEVDRLKDPEVIAAIRTLQDTLAARDEVDATLSYVDVIEAIYDALDPGRDDRLPTRRALVGQLLLLFGSPDSLEPFVGPDWDEAAVTVRTRTGGGRELRKLLKFVDETAAEVLPGDVKCTARGELLLVSQGADETSRRLLVNASRALMLALALSMIVLRRIAPFLRLVVPMTLVAVAAMGAANVSVSNLGPVTLAIPWIGLAAGLPVVLCRARDDRAGPRDWLAVAVVGACFAPLMASTLRFDAAVGVGVALGAGVAALFLWGDGGVDDS